MLVSTFKYQILQLPSIGNMNLTILVATSYVKNSSVLSDLWIQACKSIIALVTGASCNGTPHSWLHNPESFIWDKCCHRKLCLRLMAANFSKWELTALIKLLVFFFSVMPRIWKRVKRELRHIRWMYHAMVQALEIVHLTVIRFSKSKPMNNWLQNLDLLIGLSFRGQTQCSIYR